MRPFKLWSVYLFDVIIEFVDLIIVSFNVGLVYKKRSDSYNIWMMVMVFFKSLFILVFVLVYIFFAWKNWWTAKRKGMKSNPNITEQYFYEEQDERDMNFE